MSDPERLLFSAPTTLSRKARERLHGHAGCVVWLTGLSGAGKSALANALEAHLHRQGTSTFLLDGDHLRQGLNRDLGFSDADRAENIRRVAEVARLMLDAGLVVITAFISPFARDRALARSVIGAEHFLEAYISTSLAVCQERDPKGLYRKARQGLLPNMTGVGSAYEVPQHPDIVLDCGVLSVTDAVAAMALLIERRGL